MKFWFSDYKVNLLIVDNNFFVHRGFGKMRSLFGQLNSRISENMESGNRNSSP